MPTRSVTEGNRLTGLWQFNAKTSRAWNLWIPALLVIVLFYLHLMDADLDDSDKCQWAAWYCSTISAWIRPRALTVRP